MKKCTMSFMDFPCLSSVPPLPLSWSPTSLSARACAFFSIHKHFSFLCGLLDLPPGSQLQLSLPRAKSLQYLINYYSGLSTGLLTFHLPPPLTPARLILAFIVPFLICIYDYLESGLLILCSSLHVSPQELVLGS